MSQTESQPESEGKPQKSSATQKAQERSSLAAQEGSKKPSDKKGSGKKKSAMQSKESASGKARKKSAPKPALTEQQINAPTVNTLIMLGIMSISTLVMWAAGRAACNYHVPGESLTPRVVSLEDRTRTAKDVGIEFAQALSGADFKTARQLVLDSAMPLVDAAKRACGDCEKEKARREELVSRGIVHQANARDSVVEVRTYQGEKRLSTRFFGIEREKRKWRVTRSYDRLEQAELKGTDPEAAPMAPLVPTGTSEQEAVEREETAEHQEASEQETSKQDAP